MSVALLVLMFLVAGGTYRGRWSVASLAVIETVLAAAIVVLERGWP